MSQSITIEARRDGIRAALQAAEEAAAQSAQQAPIP